MLTEMIFHDGLAVQEGMMMHVRVVLVIEVQRFSDEVQAVEMVKSLNIRWETAAVFLVDLYLTWQKATLCCLCFRNDYCSVYTFLA